MSKFNLFSLPAFLFSFAVLCSFPSVNCISQDSIQLMSGRKMFRKVNVINVNSVIFSKAHKNNPRERFLDKADVFKIKYSSGKERFLFFDTVCSYYIARLFVNNDILNVLNHKIYKTMHVEVRDFVAGEVFAINNYKPRIATAGSILAGAMGGYLAFYGMLVPASYVVGTSSVSPDIRNIKGKLIIPADMKNNEYFIRGYKDRARKKEIRNTIWGGLAGLSAMIIIKSINSSNK